MNAPINQNDLLALIASLKAENAALKAAPASKITLKVGEKGTVCLYHGARYPIAKYASEWSHLIPWLRDGGLDKLDAFIATNRALIAERGGAGRQG